MNNNYQQLENEMGELTDIGSTGHSIRYMDALESACLILDRKFGIDFHKKNPKLAVQLACTIIKNNRMNDLKDDILNGMVEYLDTISDTVPRRDARAKDVIFEDYADSFRF